MQELLVAMEETKFFGRSYLSKHDVFSETFSGVFFTWIVTILVGRRSNERI